MYLSTSEFSHLSSLFQDIATIFEGLIRVGPDIRYDRLIRPDNAGLSAISGKKNDLLLESFIQTAKIKTQIMLLREFKKPNAYPKIINALCNSNAK